MLCERLDQRRKIGEELVEWVRGLPAEEEEEVDNQE
jgi:hypothetical protein